ncbi:hypothetical protein TWF506_002424 [Arthrobotrys conoides]|uniref:Uncharacterized protein n=1 Tax=Arthrobotrys conoides TaxID=74498 RepID=A0AAN8RRG4_9PEZI
MHLFINNRRRITETIFIGALVARQLSPTSPTATQDNSACSSVPGWPTPAENGGYFDRGTCWNRTKGWLNDTGKTFPERCTKLLFKDATPENTVLTFLGCEEFCGRDQGWYSNPDALERVLTWIFPIFFLLFNLNLPAIGWEKFFAITHALGDPIDSVWSLLDKIYAWEKCYVFADEFVTEEQSIGDKEIVDEAERLERIKTIATTFAGIEEIMGHRSDSEGIYWEIASSLGLMKTTRFDEWRRAATTLVDDRTNDFIRTGVAISLFIFQFFSELVFDSDSVPPGGRLATSWEELLHEELVSGLSSAWLKIYDAARVVCQIKEPRAATGTTTLIRYTRLGQSIYLVHTKFM